MSLKTQIDAVLVRIATEFKSIRTALGDKAPLASPALTGNPTAPTPAAGDSDTSIATTAFVNSNLRLPIAVTALPGSPVANQIYLIVPTL